MPTHLFDTSALVRRYIPEPNTPVVDALLAGPGPHFLPRLGLVEARSAFAKSVRTGRSTPAEFAANLRRFRADARGGLFRVVEMTRRDYARAARLIRRYGLQRGLRTLDALQLAVALRVVPAAPGLAFVSGDQVLLAVAAAQGLAVVHV